MQCLHPLAHFQISLQIALYFHFQLYHKNITFYICFIQSTNPLNKLNPPKMIWDSIKTKPLKTTSTSSAAFSTLDPKLIAKYKKFQTNLEKPVYLMGGTPDKILFGITCALVAAGVIQSLKLFYDMANPKKV